MKNLFDCKLLNDINDKIEKLENSFVEISWLSYEGKARQDEDVIGLFSNRRSFLKKSYTFSPL